MRIGIMGAGAIGLLFGAYLHQAGHEIFLITRTKGQARQLESQGCRVQLSSGKSLHFYPQTMTIEEQVDSHALDSLNLLMITVKQPSLPVVIHWLKKHVSAHVPLLCLMNGLGHESLFAQHISNPMYYGITASGATRLDATSVVERGRGITRIGLLGTGESDMDVPQVLGKLINSLEKSGLAISFSAEIDIDLWKKCVVNSCINPLTALFNVPNGQLIYSTDLHQLMHQLYSELVPLIKKAKGARSQKILNNGRLWQEIEDVCRNTSENISSMLTDIKTNQQTEIEAMTGFFLRMAPTYRLDLPSHQFIYHALQFLAQRGED